MISGYCFLFFTRLLSCGPAARAFGGAAGGEYNGDAIAGTASRTRMRFRSQT